MVTWILVHCCSLPEGEILKGLDEPEEPAPTGDDVQNIKLSELHNIFEEWKLQIDQRKIDWNQMWLLIFGFCLQPD